MGNFSLWYWLIGLVILVLPLLSIPTFRKYPSGDFMSRTNRLGAVPR